MKIPETSANVGAYYGNEDNVQWQPNGVIIDSGVGGGVVGSGDAGIHRPLVYPVPRGHVPGYVMAGAFYPPAPYGVAGAAGAPAPPGPQDDFEDYMWMENEEEFDKQVMQQLEEEALMEQCIEAMLEDEQRERQRPLANGHKHASRSGGATLSLEETVSRSTLNPLAAEFVPTRRAPASAPPAPVTPTPTPAQPTPPPTQPTEEKPPESTESPPPTEPSDAADDAPTDENTEEPTVTTETPEVSAADVADSRPRDKKDKPRADRDKRTSKPEPKAKTPAKQPAKSEPKLPAKKKEAKAPKSDVEDTVDSPKQPSQAPTEECASGIKPINYAAAARANKPKKPASAPSPPAEKAKPEKKTPVKVDKTPVKVDKTPVKVEKPVQRKNSAK